MNAWLRFWAKCCACCLPKGLTKTNPPQATESDPLLVSLAPESPVRIQQTTGGGLSNQGVSGAPSAPHKSTPLPRARRVGAINDIPKVSFSTSFSESSLSRVSTPPASDSPLVLDPKTPINGDVSDRVQFSITSSPQAVARAPLKSIPFGISLAIDSPIHSHSNSSSSSSASSSLPISGTTDSGTTGADDSIQTVSPSSFLVSSKGLAVDSALIPTPSDPASQSSSTSSSSSVQSSEEPVVVVPTTPCVLVPEILSTINTPISAIISSTTTSSSASPTATSSSLSGSAAVSLFQPPASRSSGLSLSADISNQNGIHSSSVAAISGASRAPSTSFSLRAPVTLENILALSPGIYTAMQNGGIWSKNRVAMLDGLMKVFDNINAHAEWQKAVRFAQKQIVRDLVKQLCDETANCTQLLEQLANITTVEGVKLKEEFQETIRQVQQSSTDNVDVVCWDQKPLCSLSKTDIIENPNVSKKILYILAIAKKMDFTPLHDAYIATAEQLGIVPHNEVPSAGSFMSMKR